MPKRPKRPWPRSRRPTDTPSPLRRTWPTRLPSSACSRKRSVRSAGSTWWLTAPAHVPVPPALDVPRDVAQGADQILDAVRRREEAAEPRWQSQLQHRERFLQAFAHTGGGLGVAISLQPRREGRQLAAGHRRAGRLIGPAQGGPDLGLPRLRHERIEGAPPVELAAL